MTETDEHPDDEFEAWLVARHEAIRCGDGSTSGGADASTGPNEILDERYRRADACLQGLELLRRKREAAACIGLPRDTEFLPPRRIGRYEIRREIGRGGLGVVFEAYDPRLKRTVALKVPRAEAILSDRMQLRFIAEAEIAARLRHPNVCAVFETDQAEVHAYIAEEYCRGPNLAQWLETQTQPLSPETAVRLFLGLAEGVQHAHSHGVLHRDLKPSNVLLDEPIRKRGPGELPFTPKIADFGLAKVIEERGDRTLTGMVLGTPDYMAPEQAEGRVRDIDVTTDIFSLGVMLYEALTGTRPFEGKTRTATLTNVLSKEPIRPRKVRPDLPPDLEAICLKCLAKQGTDRYQSARELADDLTAWLEGRPTQARPVTAAARLVKWGRRNPALALMASLATAAVVALVCVSLFYNVRLQRSVQELRRIVYVADMRAAFDEWEHSKYAAARARLDRYLPDSSGEDLRTFPWYLLDRQLDEPYLSITAHPAGVRDVAFSPDGQFLVTCGDDGHVRWWGADTGKATRAAVGFHHDSIATTVEISGDGMWLLAAYEDGMLAIQSLADPTGAPRFVQLGDAALLHAVFSPSGHRIAIGDRAGMVYLVKTEEGVVEQEFSGHTAAVWCLAFSPNESQLASGSEDRTILLRNLYMEGDVRRLADPSGSMVTGVQFLNNGAQLASCSRNRQQVHVWDLNPIETLATHDLPGSGMAPLWLAASPDEEHLLVACKGGVARIMKPHQSEVQRVLMGHTRRIYRARFDVSGARVATASADGTVRLWHMDTVIARQQRSERNPPYRDVAFSPDGRFAAAGVTNGGVDVWDARTGHYLHTLPASVPDTEASYDNYIRLAFSPDGESLTVAGPELPDCRVWNTANGKLVHALPCVAFAATYSEDGREVVTAEANRVRHWDAASGRPIRERPTECPHPLDIECAPRGNLLAYRSKDTVLSVVDTIGGQTRFTIEDDIGVYQWEFSPNGSLLACSLGRSEVVIWDADTASYLGTLAGHTAPITDVSFDPDNRTLATTAADGTLRLWDLRTHQLVAERSIPGAASVAFSARRSMLACVGGEHRDRSILSLYSAARLDQAETDLQLELPLPQQPDVPYRELFREPASVTQLSRSPDGRLLAVSGRELDVALYSLPDFGRVGVVQRSSAGTR